MAMPPRGEADPETVGLRSNRLITMLLLISVLSNDGTTIVQIRHTAQQAGSSNVHLTMIWTIFDLFLRSADNNVV